MKLPNEILELCNAFVKRMKHLIDCNKYHPAVVHSYNDVNVTLDYIYKEDSWNILLFGSQSINICNDNDVVIDEMIDVFSLTIWVKISSKQDGGYSYEINDRHTTDSIEYVKSFVALELNFEEKHCNYDFIQEKFEEINKLETREEMI